MDYPGNSSLSNEVRDRVLNTYRQTLELATQGNRQEASLGCDFILRLDPEFEPARLLMSRLERGDGPVTVDDLRPGGEAYLPVAAPESDPFGELEDVDLEAPAADETHAELRRLLDQRRFAEVLQHAEDLGGAASDVQVAHIVKTARSRLEAEPYIQSFLDSARAELRAGNPDQASRLLESARELDAENPALLDLEKLIGVDAGAAAPPSTPSPSAPSPPSAGPDPSGGELDPGLEALGSVDLSFGGDSTSTGGAAPASADDGRIRDLLAEGQTAFDQADYQGAIDAWSRIFLIDIDHQEASRRIEEARRLKAEHEREVEEVYHEGVSALEGGDADRARDLLEKVLGLQPNHLAAKEYLEKIDSGALPESPAVAPPPPAPVAAPTRPRRTPVPALLEDEDDSVDPDLILVPPEPGEVPTSATRTGAARPNRTFLYVGAAVLVLVLAGAWTVLQFWSRWFPNADEPTLTESSQDPIRTAKAVHDLGNVDRAVAQLKRVPPDHPRYEEAQALISQWEAEAGQASAQPATGSEGGESTDGGPAPASAEAERQQELVAQARQAARSGEQLRAEGLLLRAQQIAKLDTDGEQFLAEIHEQLEPLRREIELVRGGDWEFALPDLWRKHEDDPTNPNINQLLITCYFDLGVRDLQRGDATSATNNFEEAADLVDGSDPELERHLAFARAYQGRNKDLLYQIYVKYLPLRR